MLKEIKLPKDEQIFDLAELFKIFGDSTRMKILFVLFETKATTGYLSEILNMTPSAISHQINSLKRSKLVKSQRNGKLVYHCLADNHVRTIIEMANEHIEE